jgi:hypothetical protein
MKKVSELDENAKTKIPYTLMSTKRVESKAISVTTKRFEPVEEIKRDSSIPIHLIPLYSPAASNPRCSSASSIPSAHRPPLSPTLAGRAPLSPIDSSADAAMPRLHSRRRAQTLAAPLTAAVEDAPASFFPCCRCLPRPPTAAAAKAHKASCLGAAPSLLLLDAEDVDLTRRPW